MVAAIGGFLVGVLGSDRAFRAIWRGRYIRPLDGRNMKASRRGEYAMKAMLLVGHGGTELMLYGEAPDPKAGPGEVVVDVHAASVNGADPKVRRGGGRYQLDKFPPILGPDFSGVVRAGGPGCTAFWMGGG